MPRVVLLDSTEALVMPPIVEPEDLEAIVAMAMNELYQLHEGNIARFRLRLNEFRAWPHKTRSS